ncbi:unnamed protein product, partial [Rangifer tarandus platyrhynchus]
MGSPPWLSGDATEAGRSRCHRQRQRELPRQKNVKKQSPAVKGKRRDDGLPAAARKERDSEIMQQKQKRQRRRQRGPG